MASLTTARTSAIVVPSRNGYSKAGNRAYVNGSFAMPRLASVVSHRAKASAIRVSAPRQSGSTIGPLDGCVERTDVEAMKSIASDYFAQVGEAEPCLQAVMADDCVMTDRVLGWCFRGRGAVEGHFRDFHAKYCSHEFSHLDVLTNMHSRTVCAHWALTVWTREEDVPCVPDYEPSKTFQLSGVHLFTLDSDNKIANITTYRTACNADEKFNY